MSFCGCGLARRLVVLLALLACPAMAQESPSDLEFHVAGGISGFGIYRQGVWSSVRSEIVNPTPADQQPLIVASFKAEPWLQFASRVWVPAGSRRWASTMLCWTSDVPPPEGKTGSVELDMLLISDAARPERVLDREISLLPTRSQPTGMGLYTPSDDPVVRDLFDRTLEEAKTVEVIHSLSPTRSPVESETWAAINATLLAQPVTALDSAQIEAVRRWLWSGGRLWLMLDRVDAATPGLLMGSQWTAAVIDEVTLSDVAFVPASSDKPPSRVELDYPERMTRVMLGDDADTHVLYTVGGYPAAWWQPVGKGQVLVTTVGANAWHGGDAEALRRIGQFLSKGMSASLLQRNRDEDAVPDPMAQYVSQQVGHEVLGVAPVAGMLALMTFGLLAGGLMLMRRGRLEWSAVLAVGLIIVCSLALILIGRAKQANTPGVVAVASTLDAQPSAGVAKAQTLIQVYRPPGSSADATLAVEGPLPVINRQQIIGRGQLRFVQTDRGQWHFQNLDLAPGVVRTLQLSGVTELPPGLSVVGTFDEAGLVLDAQLPDGQTLSDPLIVTPQGLLAPTRRPDGRWAATPDDKVSSESPFRSAMLSQQQIQRQAVYHATLTADRPDAGPVLMGWLPDAPAAVTMQGDDIPFRADTLASLPIHLVAPPPGRRLTIPPALLAVSAFRNPSLGVSSTAYEEAKHQFITGLSTGQTVALRFTFPDAVADMQLESVELTLDLVCPQRDYEVIIFDGQQMRTVLSDRGAMGRQSIKLTGDDLPPITDARQVIVGVRVKDVPPSQVPASWTINELIITPTGVMPTK